jgi:hypothetical protein
LVGIFLLILLLLLDKCGKYWGHLENLNLSRCPHITSDILNIVYKKLPNLKTLNLEAIKITDDVIFYL